MDDFMIWVALNSWCVPLAFISLAVLCGIAIYWITSNFTLAMAVESAFCLLYIIVVWIPFHTQLNQDYASLISFIMVFIITSTFAMFGTTKGGVGDH